VNKTAIASWLNANLTLVAELNAARKILNRQLREGDLEAGTAEDLRTTAIELRTTTLLLRALPPIPEPTAAAEFAASLDAFESALSEILRSTDEQSPVHGAAMATDTAATYLLRSIAHYRAATGAIDDAFGT
jgi:hypothetical protein